MRKKTPPPRARQRSLIKQQISALIRAANRAESETNGGRRPQDPPPELIAIQLESLKHVVWACENGMGMDEIENELVAPLIDASIVGDLAWLVIRQVMAAATSHLRRHAERVGFPTRKNPL